MNVRADEILNARLFMNAHTFGIRQIAIAGSSSTVGASLILWLALAVEGLVIVFPKSCTRCSFHNITTTSAIHNSTLHPLGKSPHLLLKKKKSTLVFSFEQICVRNPCWLSPLLLT